MALSVLTIQDRLIGQNTGFVDPALLRRSACRRASRIDLRATGGADVEKPPLAPTL